MKNAVTVKIKKQFCVRIQNNVLVSFTFNFCLFARSHDEYGIDSSLVFKILHNCTCLHPVRYICSYCNEHGKSRPCATQLVVYGRNP